MPDIPEARALDDLDALLRGETAPAAGADVRTLADTARLVQTFARQTPAPDLASLWGHLAAQIAVTPQAPRSGWSARLGRTLTRVPTVAAAVAAAVIGAIALFVGLASMGGDTDALQVVAAVDRLATTTDVVLADNVLTAAEISRLTTEIVEAERALASDRATLDASARPALTIALAQIANTQTRIAAAASGDGPTATQALVLLSTLSGSVETALIEIDEGAAGETDTRNSPDARPTEDRAPDAGRSDQRGSDTSGSDRQDSDSRGSDPSGSDSDRPAADGQSDRQTERQSGSRSAEQGDRGDDAGVRPGDHGGDDARDGRTDERSGTEQPSRRAGDQEGDDAERDTRESASPRDNPPSEDEEAEEEEDEADAPPPTRSRERDRDRSGASAEDRQASAQAEGEGAERSGQHDAAPNAQPEPRDHDPPEAPEDPEDLEDRQDAFTDPHSPDPTEEADASDDRPAPRPDDGARDRDPDDPEDEPQARESDA